MTALAKPHHEPEENELQLGLLLDSLIDTLDDALERALRHGLEERVRAAVAKHLPAQPPPPAPAPQAVAFDIDTLLGLSNAVQALDETARRAKAGSPQARRCAACRDFLRAHIETLKGKVRA